MAEKKNVEETSEDNPEVREQLEKANALLKGLAAASRIAESEEKEREDAHAATRADGTEFGTRTFQGAPCEIMKVTRNPITNEVFEYLRPLQPGLAGESVRRPARRIRRDDLTKRRFLDVQRRVEEPITPAEYFELVDNAKKRGRQPTYSVKTAFVEQPFGDDE